MKSPFAWSVVLLVAMVAVAGVEVGLGAAFPVSNAHGRSDAPTPGSLTPASGGVSASPNPDDVGRATTISDTGLCGAALCTYTYSGLPPGCSSANTDSLTCSPTGSGSYGVEVTATAVCALLVCVQFTGTVTLVVNPDVAITSLTASPSDLDLGTSFALTIQTTGGTSPISYGWSDLPSPCSSSDSDSISCTPSSSGTYTITGSVSDTLGSSARSEVSVVVAPTLSISSFGSSPSQTGLGSSVTFTVTPSGGISPYTYSYSGLPTGCSSTDAASFSCIPTSDGTYNVVATVTDSGGESASASTAVTIDSGPSITAATWSPSTIDLGQTSTMSVIAIGGTPSYTYTYSHLPPGCSSSDTASLSCTPTATGTFAVTVTVADANGLEATATAPLVVGGTTSALNATVNANRTSGTAPLNVGFASTVSGGHSPYMYVWVFGDGGTSAAANPDHDFQTVGEFNVTFTVKDSSGTTASRALRVVVNAAPGADYPLGVRVAPATCGPVSVGTTSAVNGSVLALPAAPYSVVAPTCPELAFAGWSANGSASLTDPSQASAVVNLRGPANLTATYVTAGSPPPGSTAPSSGLVLSAPVRTVFLVAALVVAIWGLVYLGRRRSARTPGSEPARTIPPAGPLPDNRLKNTPWSNGSWPPQPPTIPPRTGVPSVPPRPPTTGAASRTYPRPPDHS